MICYHTTNSAEAILREGFRDSTGYYLTNDLHTGVWLASTPLTMNEGAKGTTVLSIDIPEEVLAPYEWIEDEELDRTTGEWVPATIEKPYREFCIPAHLVNSHGPPKIENDIAV